MKFLESFESCQLKCLLKFGVFPTKTHCVYLGLLLCKFLPLIKAFNFASVLHMCWFDSVHRTSTAGICPLKGVSLTDDAFVLSQWRLKGAGSSMAVTGSQRNMCKTA